MRDGYLFREGSLADYLRGLQKSVVDKVAMVPSEDIRFTPEAVIEQLSAEHRVDPISFDWASMTRTEPREDVEVIEQWGERITLPIHVLTITVPMSGDPEILRRQADTYSLGALEANIRANALAFSVRGKDLTPDAVLAHIDSMKGELERQVAWGNDQVEAWAPNLRSAIEAAVSRRRDRLEAAASLSASLDIPLAPTSPERRVTVPVARKTIRFKDRERAKESTGVEPTLADAVYDDVLRTLGSLARALERLPTTAARFREEELRDLALFILNSHWEGAARGEVFNGLGKTDILLPWKDRNAFIGECKFWKGPKAFTDAIDQLMNYLVWQDSKAAIILFIRAGEPSEVIAKADKVVREHPSFRSAEQAPDPTVRRDYVMASASDSQRFIKLALLPVVIPSVDDEGDNPT